jgi:hypothetical protein
MLNLDLKTLIYSYDELFVLFTTKGKKIGERRRGGGEDGRWVFYSYYDITVGATLHNQFLFGRA